MHPTRSSGVLDELRDRIRGIEVFSRCAGERNPISTCFAGIDRLLADGGLRAGTLIEWLGDAAGSGAASLALAVAGRIVQREGMLVVIDETNDFYPVGAAQLQIPLDRTIVVRPDSAQNGLWAWEQALRCPGVAVTFGKLGRRDERAIRRLQMAVEVGGGLGFLLPIGRLGTPWATTRIHVESIPSLSGDHSLRRRLRVGVVRGQRGSREAATEVELGNETSLVSPAPQLARPVAKRNRKVG